MAKTLLYRLFGVGKIPPALRAELQQEGVLLIDEGVPGSATYRNFRAPGQRAGWRRTGFSASLALTNTRLLAYANANMVINVPRADPRLRALRCTLEGGPTLCVAFDAALFHADWSGEIAYRFRTAEAPRFLELLPQPDGAA